MRAGAEDGWTTGELCWDKTGNMRAGIGDGGQQEAWAGDGRTTGGLGRKAAGSKRAGAGDSGQHQA